MGISSWLFWGEIWGRGSCEMAPGGVLVWGVVVGGCRWGYGEFKTRQCHMPRNGIAGAGAIISCKARK